MIDTSQPPVVGIAAYQKNAGKTRLMAELIRLASEHGLRVAAIKHAHHSFDIDHTGKDSHVMRKNGAHQVLIASRKRWVLMAETPDNELDPPLEALLARLDLATVDLVLVEGLRHAPIPKIEVYRDEQGAPFLHAEDDTVVAIACDRSVSLDTGLPRLDINRPDAVLAFIQEQFMPGAHG